MMAAHQLPFSFALRDNYAAEDFLVSEANRDAFAWVEGWPEGWKSQGLAIIGPRGSGKTHLLHLWKEKARATLLTPAVLRRADLDAAVREQPSWAVDDMEQLLKDEPLQRLLFHWFNLVTSGHGSMLLTAREPLARLDNILPDLHSRLSMLPSVEIHQPDDALLSALLIKLLQDRQLQASRPVVEYILTRVGRSFAEVQALVTKLDALSLAEKRAITIPLVKRVLAG